MLVMPLRSLGMWIGQAQRATASGERIFQVIDEPEEIADAPGRASSCRPGRARSASRTSRFEYDAGPAGARRTSTSTLAAGRTVALIGHTGSGKTTLTSLVPRFYDVDRGPRARRRRRRARRDAGARCAARSASSRRIRSSSRRPCARTSPSARPTLTDEEVERVARLAQAHEFIERLPDGYDTVIGERGITLSGGQRQRLAIARALAVDPRILILDDATASVDATTEARIRVGLREAMRDRTTLIIAHRLSTIALADEIVVLDARPRSPRAARTTSCSRRAPVYREIYEHGLLERQFADAVEARGERGGRRVRVWQPGGHLMRGARRARSTTGRGGATRRRLGAARRLDAPVPRAHGALGRLAARGDGDRARAAATSPSTRSTTASAGTTSRSSGWIVGAFLARRARELGHELRRRPTSPAGSASGSSPTCATTSSTTCSGSRSASTSATAPA